MQKHKKSLIVILLLAGLSVVLGIWWHSIIVHLSQQTGTSDSASRAYDYWSGFGSVFPWSLGILTGIILAYRHHNCHSRWCPFLGRPVEGTPYIACPVHHPAHAGNKRGVDMKTIHAHYHKSRKEAGIT
jgi:hypothetical protein